METSVFIREATQFTGIYPHLNCFDFGAEEPACWANTPGSDVCVAMGQWPIALAMAELL
jgi:hypothetical protein